MASFEELKGAKQELESYKRKLEWAKQIRDLRSIEIYTQRIKRLEHDIQLLEQELGISVKELEKLENRRLEREKQALKGAALGGAVGGTVFTTANRVVNYATEAFYPGLFILLAILLYLTDLFVTGFDGIKLINNYGKLWLFPSLEALSFIDWSMVLLDKAALIIIVMYAIFKWEDEAAVITFALLVWLITFIVYCGGLNTGLFHLAFAIIVYLTLILPTSKSRAQANLTLALLIFIDFFGYGIVDVILKPSALTFGGRLITNRLIVPLWFYVVLVYTHQYHKSIFTSLLIVFVVILNVFAVTQVMGQKIPVKVDVISPEQRIEAINFFKTGMKNFINWIRNLPTSLRKTYEAQLEYATGGYYPGLVEENIDKPLGVYLKDIRAMNSRFYKGEPIIVWADLKATTLEEPINIELNCYSTNREGTINPSKIGVYTSEDLTVECKFDELSPGTHEVKISSKFNFETYSSIKTYLIDKATLRNARKDNIDILAKYGLDKNPMSYSTNGPVQLNLGTNSPPIGVTKSELGPAIGITIENRWNGKIEKINKFVLIIPQGLGLYGACKDIFKQADGYEKIKEDGYNVYEMKPESLKLLKMSTSFKSFKCLTFVKDIGTLLGDRPIAIKHLGAKIEYVYALESSTTVYVSHEDWITHGENPQK